MSDPATLIAQQADRLRKLLAKHKSGKKLSPADLLSIGAETSAPQADQTYYDSMQAASAALDIPKGTLQWAKDKGLPGFKGSRVYPMLLLPALEKARSKGTAGHSGPRDKREVETEILIEKLDQLRWEKQRDRGEWIEFSVVKDWQVTKSEQIKSILRAKLKNEMPPKLEGLKAAEIAAKMEPLIVEMFKLFRAPIEKSPD
jgi:hypothetical protein